LEPLSRPAFRGFEAVPIERLASRDADHFTTGRAGWVAGTLQPSTQRLRLLGANLVWKRLLAAVLSLSYPRSILIMVSLACRTRAVMVVEGNR
jgi:hypothetical protein